MLSISSIVAGSFAFVRAHLPIVAVWCIVYMVGGLLMSIVAQPITAMAMTAVPGAAPQLPPGFAGAFFAMYVVMILMFITLFSAVFRAVLRPEESRAAYLRLGMTELRLLGLMLMILIGMFVAMIVVGLVLGIVVGIFAALIGSPSAIYLLLVVLYLGIFSVMAWLMIRLSPAGPLTVLRDKIVIAEAWRLSRGHFWTLFGGYLVVVLAIFITFAIFFGLTMGSYFAAAARSMADPVAMQAVMREEMKLFSLGSVRWFLLLIVGGVLGGVAVALQGAMTAIATRAYLRSAISKG